MKLTRCDNGHFYDEERFSFCPHCNQTSGSTETIPVSLETTDSNGTSTNHEAEGTKTIGVYGDLVSEPVVGWLVCIEGPAFGQDFKLRSGRNFIGRSLEMDVVLDGDMAVSRYKHAIVVYEPRGNMFLVQPGDAKELFYLNEKVVLGATEIAAYDVLGLGNTKLLFIPCCSDKFNWDQVKPKDE